jgi:diguanylate cyclase (GGDEF)-like protein
MADPSTPAADDAAPPAAGAAYAPYGQLVKMLLPSVGSIAIYEATGELVWCSDGYERPDLRALLDSLLASDTVAGRGRIESTSAGVPAFIAALRGQNARPLGSVVIELPSNQASRSGSMVGSLLRPVLDCLESRMDLEHPVHVEPGADDATAESSTAATEATDLGGLDLLLTVDENDREDASALQHLLRHCVEHLGCEIGALLVPDKNLAFSFSKDDSFSGSQLLDRTQKHLLAWAQLNNRPMVVNRVAAASDVAPYKILSCPVRDLHSRVTGLVALFRSASADDFELRDVRILEFVSRKAVGILSSEYDSLTGLSNRLIFERRAQRQLDSDPAAHALLYVDIDKLQTINESFGFHAGDEVIQRIGDVVRRFAGAEGLASRIGSDRFAILLPRREVSEAAEVGRRLLVASSHLGYVDGSESVPVSASVGLAAANGRERVAHLLASAELACKRAKQQGRNKLEIYADTGTTTLTRSRQQFVAASLQDALRKNDFRLEAQPIVGLRSRVGETVGYELLVRMRDPAGELVAPDKFLDAADRYELMPALDRWVLCSAIDALRTHAALGELAHCYTLNVSAQSLASGKYASFALEQLAQAGLPAGAFCFEIKEAAAVNHLEQAEQFINVLGRAGCKIALDDFGCGLSSLAHLKRLPVQYLKIDGRFVRRVLEDRVAESIVSGIAKAARTLGVHAIAEHVESAVIAARLDELDVEYGQGFHLGRPQPFGKAVETAAPPVRRTTVS